MKFHDCDAKQFQGMTAHRKQDVSVYWNLLVCVAQHFFLFTLDIKSRKVGNGSTWIRFAKKCVQWIITLWRRSDNSADVMQKFISFATWWKIKWSCHQLKCFLFRDKCDVSACSLCRTYSLIIIKKTISSNSYCVPIVMFLHNNLILHTLC